MSAPAGNSFVGAWRLLSSEFRYADGTATRTYDSGLLVYTADGYMSAQLMRRERPAFASTDRLGGTPDQIVAAYQGYRAYAGTYHVDAAAQTVTHHAEWNMLPNEVGADQIRAFEFDGDRLILRTPPLLLGGRPATGVLVWARARPHASR
ncbi:MAG: lipocalin-like domain-containing protein [Chloroflexi bacterium]|nr:lipocalin-like domain-containing protein [Chloroflexota bacterium]